MHTKREKISSRIGIDSAGIAIALIVIAGIIVYLNSISGAFIWDDDHFVVGNVFLRSWSYLPRIFTTYVGEGSGELYNYYRPLAIFTYLIDYTVWKLDVTGYHLSNILLHVLVAVSVFWLGYRLAADRLLAFIAGLIFAVHPVYTQTVAYISGRPDSLAGIFLLIAFCIYAKKEWRRPVSMWIFMLAAYVLALLSRENGVVLPGLILIYHYAFRRRIPAKRFLTLCAIALLYLVPRFLLLEPSRGAPPFTVRFPGFGVAVLNYLRLLLLPLHLHQEYGQRLFTWNDPRVAAGFLLGLFLLLYGLSRRKRDPLIAFGIGWFFVALIPAMNIFPVRTYMGEHWLYLPSIGLWLISAKLISSLLRSKRGRPASVVPGVLIIVCFGSLTVKQNNYFSEPLAFYERTLRYTPESARMHNNLGNIYFTRGRTEAAIRSWQEAITLDPLYPEAYSNLGNAYLQTGNIEAARALFQRALEIRPDYADAYNNLGVACCREGKIEEGIVFFRKAVESNPVDADAFSNLGSAYNMIGRKKEAMVCYLSALSINPEYARAHYFLARLFFEESTFKKALYHYKQALRLGHPPDPELEKLTVPSE